MVEDVFRSMKSLLYKCDETIRGRVLLVPRVLLRKKLWMD
jgi:hypothetical protein